jgi:hypothetical protein
MSCYTKDWHCVTEKLWSFKCDLNDVTLNFLRRLLRSVLKCWVHLLRFRVVFVFRFWIKCFDQGPLSDVTPSLPLFIKTPHEPPEPQSIRVHYRGMYDWVTLTLSMHDFESPWPSVCMTESRWPSVCLTLSHTYPRYAWLWVTLTLGMHDFESPWPSVCTTESHWPSVCLTLSHTYPQYAWLWVTLTLGMHDFESRWPSVCMTLSHIDPRTFFCAKNKSFDCIETPNKRK